MTEFLGQIEKTSLWYTAAWKCLDILCVCLLREHQEQLPEMSCRRCGRCCTKQVPRVSLFELQYMAEYIVALPEAHQEDLKTKCRRAILGNYVNAIIGEGVPCPMLTRNPDGRRACEVHDARPITCRLSGISTSLSWDCPQWKTYKRAFPTLDAEFVRPLLELFAYCRNTYASDVLNVKDRRQMMLLGTGVLALLGERPPRANDILVNAAIPHKTYCAEELYLRRMSAPRKVKRP